MPAPATPSATDTLRRLWLYTNPMAAIERRYPAKFTVLRMR